MYLPSKVFTQMQSIEDQDYPGYVCNPVFRGRAVNHWTGSCRLDSCQICFLQCKMASRIFLKWCGVVWSGASMEGHGVYTVLQGCPRD